MKKEIGSEFWTDETYENYHHSMFTKDSRKEKFLLSGRTALDYIIQDAQESYQLDAIWLPSYCCHTMVEPFVRHNIKVEFYDTFWNGKELVLDIPEIQAQDALYIMQYFGCIRDYPKRVWNIHEQGSLIIEDNTHTAICEGNKADLADYSYGSYRKWAFLPGIALAKKEHGDFIVTVPEEMNEQYLRLRNHAAHQKERYIKLGAVEDKETYLEEFRVAEEILDHDYIDYAADPYSFDQLCHLDIVRIKAKRRENARILLDGLRDMEIVTPIFPSLEEKDVPLFVPIIVQDGYRNKLRKYLTDSSIYCPIHWQISEFHAGITKKGQKIYEDELSLICDQRYDDEDMYRMLDALKKFELGDR